MHIYFSGVGGVGVGPLAMIAQDADYAVSGSDTHESEMTLSLQARGITVQIGQDGTQIRAVQKEKAIDWVVYSSALPDDHPELLFAKENNIKMSKRAEFLNHFLAEKNLQMIAIAGTHGKTTTSSMLVWLCNQLGIQISYSVGTHLSFGESAQYAPGSHFFIYECDEFDKNFLEFQPHISAITSMDYDHPDTYPTQAEYTQAFATFAAQSAHLVAWKHTAQALGVAQSANATVLDEADPGIQNIELAGRHVRQNSWIASQVGHLIFPKHSVTSFAGLLKGFPGSRRRFEQLAPGIYSDYAHHPVEIAATIEMARELNRNVVVVYQPHQNVRQHEIIRESAYRYCFTGAKKVYWLPTYLSREKKDLPILSPTELLNSVTADIQTEYDEMNDTLWQKIKAHADHGDIVVAMSAGDLDDWLRTKVTR